MQESGLTQLCLGIPVECWQCHTCSLPKPTFAQLNGRIWCIMHISRDQCNSHKKYSLDRVSGSILLDNIFKCETLPVPTYPDMKNWFAFQMLLGQRISLLNYCGMPHNFLFLGIDFFGIDIAGSEVALAVSSFFECIFISCSYRFASQTSHSLHVSCSSSLRAYHLSFNILFMWSYE